VKAIIEIIMYNVCKLSRDSCLDKFRNESSCPHFIESSFNIQKEDKCCFVINESKGNAFYDPCQCVCNRVTLLKAVLILSD
jgi:hypothetical protein